MATRRKAPRQLAPQTIEEATRLLAEYADILLGVEELRADADRHIAEIEAARDHLVAPLEQRLKDTFLQLRAWWGVAGVELTEGRRKSVELAGCVLGERITPPSLKLPGKVDESAVMLVNAGLAELCRHKVEVDKPSVLKALAGDAADLVARLTALGFKAVQKAEFFIDRAGPKPAPVEIVEETA